jgi:hypothetical protein
VAALESQHQYGAGACHRIRARRQRALGLPFPGRALQTGRQDLSVRLLARRLHDAGAGGLIHKIGLISPEQANLAGSGLLAYKQYSGTARGNDIDDLTDAGSDEGGPLPKDKFDLAAQFARITSSRWPTIPVTSPKGGQFVLHAKALYGNPFDGHTLGPVIADMEKLTGVEARRIHVDKGYRGHNHPHRFRVWISGQVRRVTASIRREMKRRAAVEPVIGHVKAEHRMDRNYLKGRVGDRINAVLAAAGYNFGQLLRWLAALLRAIIRALAETVPA